LEAESTEVRDYEEAIDSEEIDVIYENGVTPESETE
jgi:hypothetical protein